MSGVNWRCGACDEPLTLQNTLWKSADGDAFCGASSGDVIAEQYAAAGVDRDDRRSRIMHMPRSDWATP